eukprot:12400548-Karenia_brevis.AAC.1
MEGSSPSVTRFGAAILACEKGDVQWHRSMSLSELMRDLISFNAAISAWQQGGHCQLAAPLFEAVRGEGLP